MKVSVIITTFNRPEALRAAVESVLNQSLLPEEVIVVNDGRSLPANEAHLSHPLVTVVQNEQPKGANFSRNRGADLAVGAVLMFLDDDDTWEVDKIMDQMACFQSNRHVGLVYSGRRMVYDTDRSKEVYRVAASESGHLYPEILKRNIIGTTSSVAIKKDVFVKAGGFDERFPAMQDYDLWVRVCQLVPVVGDGKYNVRYTLNQRSNKSQISNSGTNQEIAGRLFLEKYAHLLRQEGISLRKRKSRMYFYIAKAYKGRNFRQAVYYAAKSFFTSPNMPAIGVLLMGR